jgi:GTP-binding protein
MRAQVVGVKELGPRVEDAQFVASAATPEQLPVATGVEIAFAGRSNVGKSSLLNMLLQRQGLVRTSKTPGCTRGVNLFSVRFEGGRDLVFADLPGYGYAQRSKTEREAWAPLIEGYLERREALRALIVLIDARRGIEDDDSGLIDLGVTRGLATFVVATKLDKLSMSKRKPTLAAIARSIREPVIGASGATGEGRAAVLERIFRATEPKADPV